MTDADIEAFEQDLAVANNGKPNPLTLWRWSQFMAYEEPPGLHLLLPAYLTKGELTSFIGQGGVGKTRMAHWLAVDHILGRDWCGLKTGGEKGNWLLLSDENSISRVKQDALLMSKNLTATELAAVESHLLLVAMVRGEECSVMLDPDNAKRVEDTIKLDQWIGIIADPLVNFAPGDIYKPGEMKESIRLLLSLFRKHAPNAATLLLHHARTGRLNIAQGVGWDAANFAIGGKYLYSTSRCQINLMPGASEDDTKLVLSCAKANNCERFETRGLLFDKSTWSYSIDPAFDLPAWQADVEGKARVGQSLCTVADIVQAVQSGYNSTKALLDHLQDAYACSRPTAERLIRKAIDCDGITAQIRGRFVMGRKADRFTTPPIR